MVRVLPLAPLEAFSLLIRLQLDAHLVVVTHKAPHEVQRRRLLHVLLKVMEGVLSHVREAKACGLVAQHDVRLLLRVLLHKHSEGVALHSTEGLQLPVLEINDVRSQVVQEGSGVRGADNAAREGIEPVLKPPDVNL